MLVHIKTSLIVLTLIVSMSFANSSFAFSWLSKFDGFDYSSHLWSTYGNSNTNGADVDTSGGNAFGRIWTQSGYATQGRDVSLSLNIIGCWASIEAWAATEGSFFGAIDIASWTYLAPRAYVEPDSNNYDKVTTPTFYPGQNDFMLRYYKDHEGGAGTEYTYIDDLDLTCAYWPN